MMHEENGWHVHIVVHSVREGKLKTAQESEAERIALAAAVDALRGPKVEPVYSDCVCRYCRTFYLRERDHAVFGATCAPCIVSKVNKHFSGRKMVETK